MFLSAREIFRFETCFSAQKAEKWNGTIVAH